MSKIEMKPLPPSRGKKLCASLQRGLNETWPDMDAEVTFAQTDSGLRILLRVACLKNASSHQRDHIRKVRLMVNWLEKSMAYLSKMEATLIMCPRPRPFTDFRAPRLSHYEGTTWVYELY